MIDNRFFRLASVVVLGIAVSALAGCQAEAHATSGPGNTPTNNAGEPKAASDRGLEHAGWEKLGQREVEGHVEHDTIEVGRAEGHFKALLIEVKDAPIELFDVVVTFGDGEHFDAKTRLVYDTNTRSRQIDLPGNERLIKRIDFKMSGLAHGTKAHVEVFGK